MRKLLNQCLAEPLRKVEAYRTRDCPVRNSEGACMKISNNLEMSSMRALGSLPSKVSGFADSGGRGARSWFAGGGGGYGYGIQG